MIYKNYIIQKNEFGYYEATNLKDCDAFQLFAKSIEELKTEINER